MKEFDAKRFIARTVVIAYLVLVMMLFFFPVPTDNKEVLIAQVATISTGFGLIVGYHFGSSSGSARKTDMLTAPTTETTTTAPGGKVVTTTTPTPKPPEEPKP